jgi:molybdopterin-dependent oxidoreductase alpha subunit
MNCRNVLAQPPLEEGKTYQVTPPAQVAAGLPAVISSMRFVQQGPGLLKGLPLLRILNQKGGVDCASCAWPDPKQRSVAEFCENGAKAMADESTSKRLTAEFFARHSVEELSRKSDHWLNAQGRLIQPLLLEKDSSHYRPLSWEEAFTYLKPKFAQPERCVFYTSGRTSNEAAFLYQLLARRLGTNNLPDCANMCHESSGVGLAETVGVGKGTVSLEDFYAAEVIVLLGQNPGTNHPRMLTALEKAKQNGARIVSINPLSEAALVRFKNPQDFMNPLKAISTLVGPGTSMADLHLPLRLNSDVPLLEYVGAQLWRRGAADRRFIEERCLGFAELEKHWEQLDLSQCLQQCGLTAEAVEPLIELLMHHQRIIFCWAMGLTQHVNAVDNIKAVVNLCLLRGAIGKPGAGLCPVRGHSNVQGDRTVGITSRPKADFLDRLGQHFGFEPPRQPGWDTVDSISAMAEGKVDLLICLGGNFLSATPDTEVTARALAQVGCTVQISTKLNRSHLVTGEEALILPCLGRSEVDLQAGQPQVVSVENSMSIVHTSSGNLTPAGPELRSEVAIVAGLAQAALGLDWSPYVHNYDRIRQEIEAVLPIFRNYNQRLRQPGGFELPNLPRQGQFPTPDGKARFSLLSLPDLNLPPSHYRMMTIRSHDQFNTTVYGLDDRYRGIFGRRRVVLMNAQDMEQEGLAAQESVDLWSGERRAEDFMVVAYEIPRGNLATYFPEANVLVPLEQMARGSQTPASKSVVVTLRRRSS